MTQAWKRNIRTVSECSSPLTSGSIARVGELVIKVIPVSAEVTGPSSWDSGLALQLTVWPIPIPPSSTPWSPPVPWTCVWTGSGRRGETRQREARWPLSGFNKHLNHPGILLKCRFSFHVGRGQGTQEEAFLTSSLVISDPCSCW